MPLRGGFYRWRRGERPQIWPYKYFSPREFECLCGICGPQTISADLVGALEAIRISLGKPIRITSAYRCSAHQAKLRRTLPPGHTATGRSSHEDGIAADIQVAGNPPLLLATLEAYFKSIGTAPTFYHVDMRRDKQRRWIYA